MEENWINRTEILLGKPAIEKLKKSKVIIYGIGGVGSFAVEGLARVGVGQLVLVDPDKISITNLNRQIHANHETIGQAKVVAMKKRILAINPEAKVTIYEEKMEKEEEKIDPSFSYVIDAVDTITTKIKIIEKAKKMKVPIISCMGTANKLDPAQFEIIDIEKTSVCPLAKIIRKELKKRNIQGVKVLYSKEMPKKCVEQKAMGSVSFVPSIAGLRIAGEVIKEIL